MRSGCVLSAQIRTALPLINSFYFFLSKTKIRLKAQVRTSQIDLKFQIFFKYLILNNINNIKKIGIYPNPNIFT
jgi:hypothetical protein